MKTFVKNMFRSGNQFGIWINNHKGWDLKQVIEKSAYVGKMFNIQGDYN